MVLLTIGVLAVSVSVLIYRYRFSLTFNPWKAHLISDNPKITIAGDSETDYDKTDKNVPAKAEKKASATSTRMSNQKTPESITPSPGFQSNFVESTLSNAPAISDPNRNSMKTTPNLMPPPPKPIPKPNPYKTPPKASTSLRPPPSAASSLRTPPGRSLAPPASLSLPASTSTLAPSARPSRKVLLEPGHSPLDWAHLTAHPPTPTFLRGDDVPPQLIRVPPSLLKYHNGRKDKTGKRKDAWGVYQGKVYNMTPYLDFHPGGRDQLMRGAGKEIEAEKLFNEIHPWVSWENMLGECLVGILVSENEANAEGGLEDMD